MENKNYLESLLNESKGITEILFHGTIESSTVKVNSTFNQSLFDALSIQKEIYSVMKSKGWYQTDVVPSQKINQTLDKLCNC